MILKVNSDDYYKYCKRIRSEVSGKIIFFNGCFDIIHLGHISLFNHIKVYYKHNTIICGINSDTSVVYQSKKHPLINDVDYRIKMIDKIFYDVYLDFIIFETPTPSSIIWNLMPDIIVKGYEYKDKEFPEKMIMDKIGGKIEYYNSNIEISTTKIIERVKELCRD